MSRDILKWLLFEDASPKGIKNSSYISRQLRGGSLDENYVIPRRAAPHFTSLPAAAGIAALPAPPAPAAVAAKAGLAA